MADTVIRGLTIAVAAAVGNVSEVGVGATATGGEGNEAGDVGGLTTADPVSNSNGVCHREGVC